jgi:hypothetical protein
MGYVVSLYFLTLPSPEMAILPVAARVRQELERSPSIGVSPGGVGMAAEALLVAASAAARPTPALRRMMAFAAHIALKEPLQVGPHAAAIAGRQSAQLPKNQAFIQAEELQAHAAGHPLA